MVISQARLPCFTAAFFRAGKLIADNLERTATVAFPEGILDIDTAEDFEQLKKKNDH
jgi:hypothetical protein